MAQTEMNKERYLEIMDRPLSEAEKQTLIDAGWEFYKEDAIHIPNDYDGCFADGIRMIRKILLSLQHRELYVQHRGKCITILEELEASGQGI